MSLVRIVIDGVVEQDGDLGEYTARAPEFIAKRLKPGAQPQPWMKTIMMTMFDALMRNESVEIRVVTDPNGWRAKVEYGL